MERVAGRFDVAAALRRRWAIPQTWNRPDNTLRFRQPRSAKRLNHVQHQTDLKFPHQPDKLHPLGG